MMWVAWMSFVCLFFGFQHISDILYAAATKKNYSPFKFKNFIDLVIFTIFLINIFITFARNLRNTISEGPGVVSWDEKAVKYCRNYVENFADETTLLILGVVALWLRVINFMRYNDYLGKFLGVVRRLLSEILLFFILYLVNLVTFSFIAESAFTDLDEFNSIPKAFKTLFYASFGTFDFLYMEQARIGKNFGISFLIAFLIINIGLFMSLFVSIITALF